MYGKQKLWLIAGVTTAGLLVLVGYFFFISPQKSKTRSVDAQVSVQEERNQASLARIRALEQQNSNLPKYEADLAAAKLALPDTSGLPDLLRSLQAIGSASGTAVTALTAGAPTTVTASAGVSGSSTSGGTSGTSSGGGSSTSTGTSSSSGSSTTGGATSTTAGTTSGGRVYALPITMTVTGAPAQLTQFLKQLQDVQPRALLINSVNESPQGSSTAKSNVMTLSLSMTAFVQPATAAEQRQLAAAAQK